MVDAITEIDCETGEVTERPLSKDEQKQRAADRKALTAAPSEIPPLSGDELVAVRALLAGGVPGKK